MEYYLTIKRNEILIHAIKWTDLEKHYAKWKKPETKGYLLYDFIYMKCPEQANHRGKNSLVFVRGWGKGHGGDC
jgi:hypothetical protein